MSERNGTVSPESPGTMPIVVPAGAVGDAGGTGGTGATAASASGAAQNAVAPGAAVPGDKAPGDKAPGDKAPGDKASGDKAPTAPKAAPTPGTAEQSSAPDLPPGVHPTAPVAVRPKPRLPRRGPLTVMGPWAPVAGGVLGLLLGVVVVLLLAGTAGSFEDRLALAFTVLGLVMLGTAGTLLADEVRMMRQRARDAAVRPQWVESTAGLLNGLTPARLLLGASAFVLFLAAFVSRG